MTSLQRLCIRTSSAQDVEQCLDTIAAAFAPGPSTRVYVADTSAHGAAFWRRMAHDIVTTLPPSVHAPLYALPYGDDPYAAAALMYGWRSEYDVRLDGAEALLRPAVRAEWDELGSLWTAMQQQAYDTYASPYGAELYNIDFLGVRPGLAGRGLGRAMLRGLLHEADAAGAAVFLAAIGAKNRDWYGRYGFTEALSDYRLAGAEGCDLYFVVRPPRMGRTGDLA